MHAYSFLIWKGQNNFRLDEKKKQWGSIYGFAIGREDTRRDKLWAAESSGWLRRGSSFLARQQEATDQGVLPDLMTTMY